MAQKLGTKRAHKDKILRFAAGALMLLAGGACSLEKAVLDTGRLSFSSPGAIVYMDLFDNPSTAWTTWRDEKSSAFYLDGTLRLLVNDPNLDIWSRPGFEIDDGIIEVDAARLAGPENNDYGVICRYQDPENFYAFLISSDGYAGVIRVLEGEYRVIASGKMEYNAAILNGSAVNRIGAGCVQSKLSLYINNTKAIETQDYALHSGEVGVMAGAMDRGGVEIAFDHFIVKNP